MTAEQFRKMALSLPEALEAAHVGHPDFRVRGKIFATLGYPNDDCGVVMLTPDQQQSALERYPDVFTPANGAWGRRGSTVVRLSAVRAHELQPWMQSAWRKVAPKSLQL
jgi:hypothetical protein